jgi:hypothetical protein
MSSDNAGGRRKVQKFLRLKPACFYQDAKGDSQSPSLWYSVRVSTLYQTKGGSCAAEAIRPGDAQWVRCDRSVVCAWDHW